MDMFASRACLDIDTIDAKDYWKLFVSRALEALDYLGTEGKAGAQTFGACPTHGIFGSFGCIVLIAVQGIFRYRLPA